MARRILVIPHVGLALGHMFRALKYVSRMQNEVRATISIALPSFAVPHALKLIPANVEIIERTVHCSVSNETGRLDLCGFSRLLEEVEEITLRVRPDLLVGDPGIQAGIIGVKFGIEWIGLMHGCYLPFPDLNSDERLRHLGRVAWNTVHANLDMLVEIGTSGRHGSWADIRDTGRILQASKEEHGLLAIGEYEELYHERQGLRANRPFEIVMTCCSAERIGPSKSFLKQLMSVGGRVAITGFHSKIQAVPGASHLGAQYDYRSLIGPATVVVTHGGHGTLQYLKGAKKVFLVPSDVDQLCNALLAHELFGWDVVFDRDWYQAFNSGMPFMRNVSWNRLVVERNNGDIMMCGSWWPNGNTEMSHSQDTVLISQSDGNRVERALTSDPLP